jgi:hypothetical protein
MAQNADVCKTCRHPYSFHASGPCRALACECKAWKGTDPRMIGTIGVKDVADLTGRSETWIKEHAEEIGGEKVSNQWRFRRNKLRVPKAA